MLAGLLLLSSPLVPTECSAQGPIVAALVAGAARDQLELLANEVRAISRSGVAADGKSERTPFAAETRAFLAEQIEVQLAAFGADGLRAKIAAEGPRALLTQAVRDDHRKRLDAAPKPLKLLRSTADALFMIGLIGERIAERIGGPAEGASPVAWIEAAIRDVNEELRVESVARRLCELPEPVMEALGLPPRSCRLFEPNAMPRDAAGLASRLSEVARGEMARQRRAAVEAVRGPVTRVVAAFEAEVSGGAGCLAALRGRAQSLARTATVGLGAVAGGGLRLRLTPLGGSTEIDPMWSAELTLARRTTARVEVCPPRAPCAAATGLEDEIPLGVVLTVRMVRRGAIDVPEIVDERGLVPNLAVHPARAVALLDALRVPRGLGLALRDATIDLAAPSVSLGFTWTPRPGEAPRLVWIAIAAGEPLEAMGARMLAELQRDALAWVEHARARVVRELGVDALHELRAVGTWASGAHDFAARVTVAGLTEPISVHVRATLAEGLNLQLDGGELRAAIEGPLRRQWRAWLDDARARGLLPDLAEQVQAGLREHLQLHELRLVDGELRAVLSAPPHLDAYELGHITVVLRGGRLTPSDPQQLLRAIKVVAARRAAAWAKSLLPKITPPKLRMDPIEAFGVEWRLTTDAATSRVTLTSRGHSPELTLTARWTGDELDFSDSALSPPSAAADLLRKLIPLDQPDWLFLENVELRAGMIHADAHLRVAGVDLPLGRFSAGPGGLTAQGPDLERLMEGLIASHLARSPITLPELGPLEGAKLAAITLRGGLSITIEATVRAPLVGALPVQLFLPSARIQLRGDPKKLVIGTLLQQGIGLVADALAGVKLDVEPITPKEPGRFAPLGLAVKEVTADVWIFKLTLGAFEIRTDTGITLPSEITARIPISIPLGPPAIFLVRPGVRFDTRGGKIGALGDITVAELSALLKIEASVTTKLPPTAVDISGKLVLASFLSIFEVNGGIDLSAAVLALDGRTTPPLDKLLDISGVFRVDGRALRAQARGRISLLGLQLFSTDMLLDLKAKKLSTELELDVVIARMKTRFTAGLDLADVTAEAAAELKIGGFVLAGARVTFDLWVASMVCEVLGFDVEIYVPSILSLTPDRVLDMLLSVLDLSPAAILRFFENLLKGKIVISLMKSDGTGDGKPIGRGDPVERSGDPPRANGPPSSSPSASASASPGPGPSERPEPSSSPERPGPAPSPSPQPVVVGGTVLGLGNEAVRWEVVIDGDKARLRNGPFELGSLSLAAGQALQQLRSQYGDRLVLVPPRASHAWSQSLEVDGDTACTGQRCVTAVSKCADPWARIRNYGAVTTHLFVVLDAGKMFAVRTYYWSSFDLCSVPEAVPDRLPAAALYRYPRGAWRLRTSVAFAMPGGHDLIIDCGGIQPPGDARGAVMVRDVELDDGGRGFVTVYENRDGARVGIAACRSRDLRAWRWVQTPIDECAIGDARGPCVDLIAGAQVAELPAPPESLAEVLGQQAGAEVGALLRAGLSIRRFTRERLLERIAALALGVDRPRQNDFPPLGPDVHGLSRPPILQTIRSDRVRYVTDDERSGTAFDLVAGSSLARSLAVTSLDVVPDSFLRVGHWASKGNGIGLMLPAEQLAVVETVGDGSTSTTAASCDGAPSTGFSYVFAAGALRGSVEYLLGDASVLGPDLAAEVVRTSSRDPQLRACGPALDRVVATPDGAVMWSEREVRVLRRAAAGAGPAIVAPLETVQSRWRSIRCGQRGLLQAAEAPGECPAASIDDATRVLLSRLLLDRSSSWRDTLRVHPAFLVRP